LIHINIAPDPFRYYFLLGLFEKDTLTMKAFVPIVLAAASLALAGAAMAAEVDMSKATCKEVGALPAAQTIGVAMWVNGYIHGKAGNAMVDTAAAHANAEKIADSCKANPDSTVVDAIAAVAKS
jgi:acid stress chaperone HdeB